MRVLVKIALLLSLLSSACFSYAGDGHIAADFFNKISEWKSSQKFLLYEVLKSNSDVEYMKTTVLKKPDMPFSSITKTEMIYFGKSIVYFTYDVDDETYAFFPLRNVTCKLIDNDKFIKYNKIIDEKFSTDGKFDYGKAIIRCEEINNGNRTLKVEWDKRFLLLNAAFNGGGIYSRQNEITTDGDGRILSVKYKAGKKVENIIFNYISFDEDYISDYSKDFFNSFQYMTNLTDQSFDSIFRESVLNN